MIRSPFSRAKFTPRTTSATAASVGSFTVKWRRPIAPGGGGGAPTPAHVLRPM